MNCKLENRVQIIEDYVTNNLTEEAAESFEIHLLQCENCFKGAGLINSISETIKDEPDFLPNIHMNFETTKPLASIQRLLRGNLPRLSIAAGLIFVTLISGYLFLVHQKPSRPYTFDEAVPYAYIPQIQRMRNSQIRSEIENILPKPLYDNFLSAMLEYKDLNYNRVLEILEKDILEVRKLDPSQDKEINKFRGNFHFYFGLSHLAISRSDRFGLAHDQRISHLVKASEFLAEAEKISQLNGQRSSDKESFFLGLAFGFSGHFDKATSKLGLIRTESPFYRDSRYFIEKWSRDRN